MSTIQGKITRYGTKGCKQLVDKENTLDKPQPKCPQCKEVVTYTDKILRCDICEHWYPIRDIWQNVAIEVYELLDKNATQQIN